MPDSVRAAIYCRISLSRFGDSTKVEDQARICRGVAQTLGWEVVEVYTDNNESAWKKGRKRPRWNAMLEAVDTGKVNGIIVYHGDRLVRRPEDLADLLRLAESKGVRLASPTGTHDLDTQRLELWIRAAFAEEESIRISERKKMQYDRWRRDGLVRHGGRGGRAFGFKKDGVTIVPAEAAIIKTAAARVLRGESTAAIARGITRLTPAGNEMTTATLRKMLARPRYAGLMPDGISPAAWPAILDRADWEMVRAILDAKAAGFGYATNARRWLLSGIALCGECWTPLQIRQGSSRKNHPAQIGYECVRPGCRHVHRSAALLDAYVTGRVIGRLNNPANPEPDVQLNDVAAAELASLAARRAEVEHHIEALADKPGSRVDVLLRSLEHFDTRIAEVRERMAGDAATRLRATHRGITREEFEALPLDVRRALVRSCYKIAVLRASKRGPGFRTEDVAMSPA